MHNFLDILLYFPFSLLFSVHSVFLRSKCFLSLAWSFGSKNNMETSDCIPIKAHGRCMCVCVCALQTEQVLSVIRQKINKPNITTWQRVERLRIKHASGEWMAFFFRNTTILVNSFSLIPFAVTRNDQCAKIGLFETATVWLMESNRQRWNSFFLPLYSW